MVKFALLRERRGVLESRPQGSKRPIARYATRLVQRVEKRAIRVRRIGHGEEILSELRERRRRDLRPVGDSETLPLQVRKIQAAERLHV